MGGRLEREHPSGGKDWMMDGEEISFGRERKQRGAINAARSWLWGLSEKAEEAVRLSP
jgi:hypothetical protein